MIHIMKLHYHYLFSSKILYISYLIIGIVIIGCLLFSNFYLSESQLLFYQKQYAEDYLLDGIHFLKLISILYGLFLVINGYVLHQYEFLLIHRVPFRNNIFFSKIVVLLLGNTVFMTYCFIAYIIIPLYLTPYLEVDSSLVKLYGDFVLFGNYYLVLFILAYTVGQNIYSLLIIISGFLLSNVSTAYFIEKASLNGFAKIMNALFVDIGYYHKIGFDFYYGSVYTAVLLIGVVEVVVFLSKKKDILN